MASREGSGFVPPTPSGTLGGTRVGQGGTLETLMCQWFDAIIFEFVPLVPLVPPNPNRYPI